MPVKQTTISSDSQSSQAEELPSTANIDPEITVTADIKFDNGNTDEKVDKPEDSQKPAIPPPGSCSTELAQRRGPNPYWITTKGLQFSK